jgi:hypothetical protein
MTETGKRGARVAVTAGMAVTSTVIRDRCFKRQKRLTFVACLDNKMTTPEKYCDRLTGKQAATPQRTAHSAQRTVHSAKSSHSAQCTTWREAFALR